MDADNVVIIRRTISQILVPYKEVEEKLSVRRSGVKTPTRRLNSNSTSTLAQCGTRLKDSKRVTFDERPNILERSRSEVCLRRKSSLIRETSLDYHEDKRDEGFVKPILRRRECDVKSPRRTNAKLSRPYSDLFPEFKVKFKKNDWTKEVGNRPEERLGRCLATLRKEMVSLREQDRQLFQQLTSLNEHIKDLKEISRIQGGLFMLCEDEEDVGKRSKRHLEHVQPTTTVLPKKEIHRNSGKRIRNTGKDNIVSVKMEERGKRVEETAFEYKEESSNDLPHARMELSEPKNLPDVPRKFTFHLERKSVSCQSLNSSSSGGKRNSFAENMESLGRRCTPISENHIQDSGNLVTRQRSISLSQLKRTTKAKELSTSDSDCSTSGCYGGSSTGSDIDLEQNVIFGDSWTNEEVEKNKAPEIRPVKRPIRYQVTSSRQPGQFRKQIVSV